MRAIHSFRAAVLAVMAGLLGACGPLDHPMFGRLSPQAQATVNTAWNNMLSPAARLDRQTLLEVVIENQLYEQGVTRGAFHTEKEFATGTVVMDIAFDERNSAQDRFELRVYDLAWNLLRAETFHREDVEAAETRLQEMYSHLSPPETQPATRYIEVPDTQPAPPTDEKVLAQEIAGYKAALAHQKKLDAATQPAPPATQP